jgi:hypothetical protein
MLKNLRATCPERCNLRVVMKTIISAIFVAGAVSQMANAMGPMGDVTHRHLYKEQEWIWQKRDTELKDKARIQGTESFTGGQTWNLPVAFGLPNKPPYVAFGLPNKPPYVAFGLPNKPPYVAFGLPNKPPYVAFGLPNKPPYVAFGLPNKPPYVAFGLPNKPPYVAFGLPNKPPYVASSDLTNSQSTPLLALGLPSNQQPLF